VYIWYTFEKLLNSLNKYISILFAGVLAFGVTVSATHMHLDDFSDTQTEHILVEDELFCVICGSLFKFTPDANAAVLHQQKPEASLSEVSTESAIPPFSRFQEGRSPPIPG
jgi:hypothetical protein